MSFQKILDKYRKIAFSERDKGDRFERLMQAYLRTDPKYAFLFKNVWLWNEFPGKLDLGGGDTGIDLVTLTHEGDYWAIQCKCFQEGTIIDKPSVDSFLSTSGREFKNEQMQTTRFAHRLWISTTNKWGTNATEAIRNQNPPVTRINLFDLLEAPVDWEKLEEGIHGEAARTPKKTLRPHQKDALDKTHEHFKTSDRGKLIMACGTGKTFNALRIAENETDGKGLILFLVPSIALLGQSLREWSADANEPINAICICSDPDITKKRLYMTATPRLFSDDTKSKAAQAEAILCSMDDKALYGEEMYRIGFGEAVERDLLTDYNVLILTLNDKDVPPAVQRMIADGKQRIIIELYDKFFKAAFPKRVEQLGIVYTPVEVLDFIIHERKYKHELHANEIVLLAYYIAAVNIENAYHDATPDPDDGIGKEKYTPFEGMVLTDTFQLGETDESQKLFSEMFPKNSERVARQKEAPWRVIMGNPPYSIGQRSANDNAQNQKYKKLDGDIARTYAKLSSAGLNKSLYDAYIKAFRWSTDRLDPAHGGIIAFVSNGSWLDGNSTDGFRKTIEKEFSSIYVFNLRGNQRTSGELSRKEGGKLFGSGSRTPIAITLLVKKGNDHE